MFHYQRLAAAALFIVVVGSCPAQDGLVAAKLKPVRDAVQGMSDPDLYQAEGAERKLEEALDALGGLGPAYLAAAIKDSEGPVHDRLAGQQKRLAVYFADRRVLALFDKLGLPDTSKLPRVRIYTGAWSQSGSEPRRYTRSYGWLVSEDAGSFTCIDDLGVSTTYRKAPPGVRKSFEGVDADQVGMRLGPYASGTDDVGCFYDEISFPEEMRTRLTSDRASDVSLAWHCERRGLHVMAASVLANADRQVGRGEGFADLEWATSHAIGLHLRTRGFLLLNGMAARADVAKVFRKAFEFGGGGELGGVARVLEEMAKEDEAHVSPTASAPLEEQVREEVFQVRNIAATPAFNPGAFSIFNNCEFSSDKKDAASRLEEIGAPAIGPLIELFGDDRPTRSYDWHRSFEPDSYRVISIDQAAREILRRITGQGLKTAEEWRAWWEKNKGRSPLDILLQAAREGRAWDRYKAIARLAKRPDRPPATELFRLVEAIGDPGCVRNALQGLAGLSKKDVVAGAMPFLKDPSLEVRLAAAFLLQKYEPAAVADSLAAGIAGECHGDSFEVEDAIGTLGELDIDKTIRTCRQLLRDSPVEARLQVLSGLGNVKADQATELLIEAFKDRTVRSGMSGGGGSSSYSDPRVGDIAGIIVAGRLGISESFRWEGPVAERDGNLLRIANEWRKRKGKPLLPEAMAPEVPEKAVLDLLPSLVSKDEATRKEARTALVALGPGAWPHLMKRLQAAKGDEQRYLDAAAREVSCTIRSVTTGPDWLKMWVGTSFDPALFKKEVVAPFLSANSLTRMVVEVDRLEDGGGVVIDVVFEEDKSRTTPPTQAECDWFASEGGKCLTGGFGNGEFVAEARKLDDCFLQPLEGAVSRTYDKSVRARVDFTKSRR